MLGAGIFWVASLGVLAAASPSDSKENLEETTIIATRQAQAQARENVSSAISILDVTDLREEGIYTLRDTLQFSPGVISTSTSGQRGALGSLYLRGTTTNKAHMRIDGIRVSDANFSLGNLLGAGNTAGLSRVEILRGSQGALYGGEAIGGVVGLYTAKGEGPFSATLDIEGGSFDTWNTSLGMQGTEGKLAYALTLSYESTDNELPNNRFESFGVSLRLDYEVNDQLRIGGTFRSLDSFLHQPSYATGVNTYSLASTVGFDYTLATLFAEYDVNDRWSTKLTVGNYTHDYDFQGRYPYDTEFSKWAFYWDNAYTWNDDHVTRFGAFYEYWNQEAGSTRNQEGLYIDHRWQITDDFSISGKLRWEDYDDYGDDWSWQAGFAYRIPGVKTLIRANVGTAFRAPSFYELDHASAGVTLGAEDSLGWDIGIEQSFADGQWTLGATYFETRVDNLISYNWATYSYSQGDGVAESAGIELSGKAFFLNNRIEVAAAYTYLEKAMAKMPKHTASLRLNGKITDQLTAGFSVLYADDNALLGSKVDGYFLVNFHTRYQINEHIALHLRVENIFDEEYLYAEGYGSSYPGAGRGIFGGVTLRW